MAPTLFRRHNDGTVTDVYEDDSVWVRDAAAVESRDIRDTDIILDAPTSHDGLRTFFQAHPDVEGVLFGHQDGREAQILRRDFGL